jgi:hypothetical protein
MSSFKLVSLAVSCCTTSSVSSILSRILDNVPICSKNFNSASSSALPRRHYCQRWYSHRHCFREIQQSHEKLHHFLLQHLPHRTNRCGGRQHCHSRSGESIKSNNNNNYACLSTVRHSLHEWQIVLLHFQQLATHFALARYGNFLLFGDFFSLSSACFDNALTMFFDHVLFDHIFLTMFDQI